MHTNKIHIFNITYFLFRVIYLFILYFCKAMFGKIQFFLEKKNLTKKGLKDVCLIYHFLDSRKPHLPGKRTLWAQMRE